ncbi:hypothetical protein EDD16DRAFT_1547913, partial [Pisolithus croceorrhizus]
MYVTCSAARCALCLYVHDCDATSVTSRLQKGVSPPSVSITPNVTWLLHAIAVKNPINFWYEDRHCLVKFYVPSVHKPLWANS